MYKCNERPPTGNVSWDKRTLEVCKLIHDKAYDRLLELAPELEGAEYIFQGKKGDACYYSFEDGSPCPNVYSDHPDYSKLWVHNWKAYEIMPELHYTIETRRFK